MLTGFWYRGVHLTRHVGEAAWVADGVLVPMTWNGVLARIDSQKIGPAEFHVMCGDCGKRELLHYVHRDQLIAKNLCFGCNFWDEVMKSIGKRTFVAGGRAYTIGRDGGGGFGGCGYTVTFPDGDVRKGNSLWHRGEVPAHWRERLPDTATLVQGW